jgi:hypothetical protein
MSAGTAVLLIEDFPGFPQFFQANAEMILRLDYDHFLPNLLQFISQPIIRAYIV